MVYAHQKLTSRLCSKKLLKYIKPNSFNKLEDIGVFRKPLNFGLYNSYLPWIIENVSEILSQKDDQEEAFQEILIKIQDQVRETHEEALKKRIQFKIDKKEEIMRKQLEKIEIKKKRKEEKIRQIEIKRIQDIKDRIQDKIFSRNENRQQLNAQTVSDISNYERQSLFSMKIFYFSFICLKF